MTAGSTFNNAFGASPIVPSNPSYVALTIAVSTVLVWPTETTGGSPYVAAAMDVTATAPGLTLMMPPANTGSTGIQTMITNVGSNSFTLVDQGGNSIAVIPTTQSWLIALTDNSSIEGVWRGYQMASTTSSASAPALSGAGLQANGTQLQTIWDTEYLAVNTLIDVTYRSTEIIWRGVTGTFQLDTIANLTSGWFCAITNCGTGVLTVSTSGGATINGASTISMQPGNSGIVICDTTGFNTVGALITPVPISGGGTGATTASDALTNLGGTTIGKFIFTAPTAAAVIALLGSNNFTFAEASVATDQVLTLSSSGNAFICSASPMNLTLPLTTSLTLNFFFAVSATVGEITLVPQASDRINGGGAGVSLTLPDAGSAALVFTDANGNWYTVFGPDVAFSSLKVTGNAEIVGNTLVGGTLGITGTATAAAGGSGNQLVNFSQFAPVIATPGRINLPGGLLLQFGSGASVTGNLAVSFNPAFSAQPYSIMVCIKEAPLIGGGLADVAVSTVHTASGFTAVTTDSATGALAAASFYWMAIGPA